MFPHPVRERLHRLCALPGRVSVGIDLGRLEVRVVALRRIAGAVWLVGTARVALERDAPPAVLVAPLREAVGTACRRESWRPRRVVMAVPAGAVLLRTLALDASAEPDEIDEAAERAVRALPVTPASLRVVWTPLGGPRPSAVKQEGAASEAVGPREHLVVAVRRETVLARQHLAAACGLGRTLVDVDAFAALRALVSGASAGVPPEAPFWLVDVGSDSLRLLAWSTGGVPLLRVVPVPREGGVEALAASVAALLVDARSAGGPSVDEVALCGSGSSAHGLAGAITASTGLACRLVDPFAAIHTGSRAGAIPVGPSAATWAAACGLALRGLG